MGSYVCIHVCIFMRSGIRRSLVRRPAVFAQRFCLIVTLCVLAVAFRSPANAQVTIAQISDTHLGEVHSPHAAEHLRQVVEMVNERQPDAVVISGDIGENPQEWQRARQILRGLRAPIYYAPGNHDVHSNDVEQYRRFFGPDYYRFQVKGVTFVVINSQLLGNYDQFGLQTLDPMPANTEAEGEKMLTWLSHQGSGHDAPNSKDSDDQNHRHGKDDDGQSGDNRQGNNPDNGGKIIIGIQHIPVFRADNLLPDSKPYWIIAEPYRSREMDVLHKLGVRHMLVGHWHVGGVFEHDGITWHVAPSTSRLLPWSGQLGFAMHAISPNGDVKTEFVSIGANQ
jgi:3',5'-cyclic AMP phosphodiesterase CpdA